MMFETYFFKDVNVTTITRFWQTPLKLDGKLVGIHLRGGCISIIDFDLWMNVEENMEALQ